MTKYCVNDAITLHVKNMLDSQLLAPSEIQQVNATTTEAI